MQLQSIFNKAFAPYGRVLRGVDSSTLIAALRETTEKPAEGTTYVPSHAPLEALPIFETLRDSVYGGMPIQIGYCSGTNTKLGCVEYHRDSEINITEGEIVFLVGKQQSVEEGSLQTSTLEAFRAPAGAAVELYATTLHYAPCDGAPGEGFRVAVVLPRGTNTDKPKTGDLRHEDALLWARNKWLIAHKDSNEAKQGAFVGLLGDDVDIAPDL